MEEEMAMQLIPFEDEVPDDYYEDDLNNPEVCDCERCSSSVPQQG
jgi:hypothetical protein